VCSACLVVRVGTARALELAFAIHGFRHTLAVGVCRLEFVVHELLLLQFDVYLDSDLFDECGESLHVDAAYGFFTSVFFKLHIYRASLDDLLHLVEYFKARKRRLSFDCLGCVVDVVIILVDELAEQQDLNALRNIERVT
jgi:hypothetical protein